MRFVNIQEPSGAVPAPDATVEENHLSRPFASRQLTIGPNVPQSVPSKTSDAGEPEDAQNENPVFWDKGAKRHVAYPAVMAARAH
jgi:hypothetical protein